MATLFTRIHDLVKQKGLTNLYLLFRHTKFQILITYFITKCMHDVYNNTAHPLNCTTLGKPARVGQVLHVRAGCTFFISDAGIKMATVPQKFTIFFFKTTLCRLIAIGFAFTAEGKATNSENVMVTCLDSSSCEHGHWLGIKMADRKDC